VSRIEENGKRSLRRSKLSARKFSAWKNNNKKKGRRRRVLGDPPRHKHQPDDTRILPLNEDDDN
jgi:hypothetical protein